MSDVGRRERESEATMVADFSALCGWAMLWGLLVSLAAGVFVLLLS